MRIPLKAFFIVLIFTALLLLPQKSAVHAVNPLYPNIRTLPPRDLRFDRTNVSVEGTDMRNVLRFSNTVYNAGEGKMEMYGNINPNTKNGIAYQRVYDSNGSFIDYQVGIFYYHIPHDHYHFEDWGQYQLWTKAQYDEFIASGGTQAEYQNAGVKTTACVLDEEFITDLIGAPYPGVYPYTGCMPNAQNKLTEGLSVGWGDTYDYYRFEQWIDLGQDTLADGEYVLRSISDPLNKMYESDGKADGAREGVADNEAIVIFSVANGELVDTNPPSGTVWINNLQVSTLDPNVTVRVIGRDDISGVDAVSLSNDGITWATYDYTGVQSVAQVIAWNLSDPAYGGSSQIGTKTVYVRFQDNSGKVSANETDTIILGAVPATSDYSNAVISDNPVSYYRFSETAGDNAFDNQGANHAKYKNSPTLEATGLIPSDTDTAVLLDGVNDHIVNANGTGSLSIPSAVTLEAWIQPAIIPPSGTIAEVIAKVNSYVLRLNGPLLELTIIQNGTSRRLQAPAGTIVAGQKYHVVGTYDGANQRLYVNGVQVASRAQTGPITQSTNGLFIGSWGPSSRYFTGTIDDVAVYNYALSASRITSHYDVGMGTSSGGPETQIDSAPVDPANSTTANFTFSSPDAPVTFECKLDNAAFTACTSPRQLTNLSNASHTFQVRAKDSNNVVDPTPASFTWTVDTVAPTIISFTRQTPTAATTNANSLVFRATFSEPVTGVDLPDFVANGSTASVTNITLIITSVYDVTLSGGNLANFNGTVGLNFNAPTVTDLAGNALANAEPTTDETYTLDNTAPTIVSFTRQNPATSPTNADTLVFRATFNEAVTGVSTGDFAVNGATTATVTAVNSVNTGTYDVTVSGGNLAGFNGVVGLNFNAPSITDLATNPFVNAEPSVDETYTVDNSTDNTPPTIISFVRFTPSASSTNADSLVFRATFSEDVTSVSAADFAVNGSTTATVSAVTAVNASVYDVTVSGGNLAGFNGAVGLNFNAPSIFDLAGNPFVNAEPTTDEIYTLDNTAPTVLSFTRQNPATSPTSADSLVFRVTFSEAVTGVGASDFAVNGTTTATVTTVNSVSTGVYDATISGGDLTGFNGVVGLNFNAPSITDLAGNAFINAEPATDETYTVENAAPPAGYSDSVIADTPVSYWRLSETSGTTAVDARGVNNGTYTNGPVLGAASLIASDSVNKAVTFDGVNDQVAINNSASLAVSSKVTLEAWITPTTIPTAGNFASVMTKAESYSLQFNGPKLEFTIMQSGVRQRLQAATGAIVVGQTYHIVGTYDGANQRLYINGVQVASRALTGAITTNSNKLYIGSWSSTVEFFKGTLDEVAIYNYDLSSAQVTSHYNAATVSGPDTQINSQPTNPTNSTVADFTFSSPTASATYECALDGAAFSACTSPHHLTGLSNASHNFQVRAKDTAGNLDPTPASFVWTVDTVFPAAVSFTRQNPATSPTSADSLVFRATFSEAATGVSAADFAVNSTTTATVTNVNSVNTSTYDVTVSGGDLAGFNGVVGLNFNAPSITDLAGNAFVNAEPATDETYTVNNSAPPAGYSNSVIADTPVSYWRLSETSGTAAVDARGVNNGTYTNGPVLGAASLIASDTANKAVTFDGVNDQVAVNNSGSLAITSKITLEAWIKPTSLPTTGNFASVVTKAGSYTLQFNGPKLEFTVIQSAVRNRLQAATGAIVVGQTYHIVGTYDGANQRLYINGVEVASRALTGPITTTSTKLYIGAWSSSSEFFQGTIDEVAVYNYDLTDAQVTTHYNAATGSASSGTLAQVDTFSGAPSASPVAIFRGSKKLNSLSKVLRKMS